jgi:hypothetical protein
MRRNRYVVVYLSDGFGRPRLERNRATLMPMQTLEEQGRVPIKLWTDGVEVEPAALEQIRNVASLPVVGPHVAIMPDVHWGVGATPWSTMPTPPDDRQQLHHELAGLLVELAALRQEMESPAPRHEGLVGQIVAQ